jgi:KUP system potassium uptake protein
VARHPHSPSVPAPDARRLSALTLAALGVVYGDIGTSPLYAVRECFHNPHGHAVAVSATNVLGVLSLVFWSLVVVISVKYLLVVTRADNRGEGGILSLMALVAPPSHPQKGRVAPLLVLVGLFGAALLYGDGIITPAITVLGAVEGLEVATPGMQRWVVPLTIAVLVGLFVVQKRGTARVGALFGPITLVWFLVIAALGVSWIVRVPRVLGALSPHHAVLFFRDAGWHAFLVLGSVFLVVTGGEALYADMGHFGVRPIRRAWFAVVVPALLCNYFGQGALLLAHPEHAPSPFYRMAPGWGLYPLVALATVASVIASQAVITGAFSLTWQAAQLGYLPRVQVRHTSAEEMGQIYIPEVNWALLGATVLLVLGFKSSSALAAAYGVAVTTTMVITTILAAVVMRRLWKWKLVTVALVTTFFLVIDLAFFGANIIKLPDGGWFPLAVGIVVITLMTTWRTGRIILFDRLRERGVPFETLLAELGAEERVRLPGVGVYMTGSLDWVPPALTRMLKHLNSVHERVVLLSVTSEPVPHVLDAERVELEELPHGLYRVRARSGFMEQPDVPALMREIGRRLPAIDPERVTYILGRETLLATDRPGMAIWRERLFAFMSRNAGRATEFFGIPPDRVLEIGAQIEL